MRIAIAKRDRESAARPNLTPAFVAVAAIHPPAESRTDAPINIRLAEGHRARVLARRYFHEARDTDAARSAEARDTHHAATRYDAGVDLEPFEADRLQPPTAILEMPRPLVGIARPSASFRAESSMQVVVLS